MNEKKDEKRIIIIFWHFDITQCLSEENWQNIDNNFKYIKTLSNPKIFNTSEAIYQIYLISYSKMKATEIRNDTQLQSKVKEKIVEIVENNRFNEILVLIRSDDIWEEGLLKDLEKELIKRNCKFYKFGKGTEEYIYKNGILDASNNCFSNSNLSTLPWDELWETYYKKKTVNEIIHKFLFSISPLYLSLQAFWGVAVKEIKKEDSGQTVIEFVKIGTRNGNNFLKKINKQRNNLRPKDVENIDNGIKNLFPNPDAFLLVGEAEYDFYAPLINLVVDGEKGIADGKRVNCNEEKEMYEMPTLKEVIEICEKEINDNGAKQFFADLKKVTQNFKKEPSNPNINNSTWRYSPEEFISYLRELCAILANTCEGCQKDGKYFVYKGKNENFKFQILDSLGGDFTKPHCKLKEINGNGCSYSVLIDQLISWGLKKSLSRNWRT